jgi:L-ascorbate metabolism protein UlaG (beta-lactamase superfamily)
MITDIIHWLGHDGFRIEGEAILYIDPWKLEDPNPKADIICLTHDHYDHFSPEDVEKILKPGTEIFTTSVVAAKLGTRAHTLRPGDVGEAHGVRVEAVPAYNTNKAFHPKENQLIGFVVEMEGSRIYHAGDTDLIPEMKEIRADVALLPVSGTYVMTAEEAAEAAALIGPKVAIPMHYGEIVGSAEDALRFKELYGGECLILEPE